MANELPLLSDEKVKFKGVFNMEELYVHSHDWLEYKGFSVAEKQYKEAVKPNGKELTIKWEAEKELDEYSKIKFKIKFEVIGLSEVMMQQAGKEIKMNKGEVSITTTAILVTDKDDEWESKPLFKFMQRFYEKYLYGDTIERYKGMTWQVGWDFHNEVKAFLSLYKY